MHLFDISEHPRVFGIAAMLIGLWLVVRGVGLIRKALCRSR